MNQNRIAPPHWRNVCFLTCQRQLQLNFQDGLSLVSAMVFLLLSVCIFHIAIGYNALPDATSKGLLLVCIIFSLIISCPAIIEEDYQDSSWEQLYLTGIALEVILLAKVLAQTLSYYLLFALLLPVCFLLLQLDWFLLPHFMLVAALLIIINSFNIMFATSVSIGSRHRFLSAVLVLPLAIPSVIIAVLALSHPKLWLLLLALLCMLGPVFTIAAANALKQIFYYD